MGAREEGELKQKSELESEILFTWKLGSFG